MNSRTINVATVTLAALASALLAGCGQKGALYLPESTGEVITRPMQTAEPASTPAPSPPLPETEAASPEPTNPEPTNSQPKKPAAPSAGSPATP